MKTVNVFKAFAIAAIAAVLISACDSTVTNTNNNTQAQNFSIPAWDYSDNFYFVDTLYKRSFRDWQDGITSGFIDSNRIIAYNNTFEVWVQCDSTNMFKRHCVGKVMLGARPPQGYDTSVTNPEIIMGDKFAGYFRKLDYNEYSLNDTAGFVGLNISIPENFHVGVVYTNYANQNFGKGSYNSQPDDTLILKLIKVDYQSPDLTPLAWKLKMKNVYKIPYTNLISSSAIYTKFNVNNQWRDTITGYTVPLITMLKLDRFNNSTLQPPPDGKFDWLLGKTIFPSTGYLIFPTLEPFGRDLTLLPQDSIYCYNEIYTQRKTQAQISYKAALYSIKGNAVYN